ncbi:MAG: glycosyltransferase family 1 protein [Deltaproteobacteria bacterium]|jgi:sterol 3beta-glucosyltransferase|nr:glycosyltransferase family 1 protein [Deltaproteobacteria bacterium]
MKVAIITAGSRGDVQPFVALGLGLKKTGHQVKICTHSGFQSFITQYGLDYGFMNDEMSRFLISDRGHEAIESSGGTFGWLKTAARVSKQFNPIMRRMLEEEWKAAQGSDVIIYHPKAAGGYDIAEKLDVPLFISIPLPLLAPTRAFPCVLFSRVKLGGWFNKLSYSFLRYAAAIYGKTINTWRREILELPPRRITAGTLTRRNGQPVPIMYSYSSHVIPRPDDWPETTVVTGYWFLNGDENWAPSRALVDFLAAGSPPVYIGFGSIAGRNPARTTTVVTEALKKSGQRGIIATGWGGLEASLLPETMFVIDQAPHNWLLPRVAAVVHHGGAGTTAAGLRAGKPTIICPFFGDQPFWGSCISEIGVGPEPIPQKKLTVENLAAAIQVAVTSESMRKRAAALGEKIRMEDGVERAIQFIEQSVKMSLNM